MGAISRYSFQSFLSSKKLEKRIFTAIGARASCFILFFLVLSTLSFRQRRNLIHWYSVITLYIGAEHLFRILYFHYLYIMISTVFADKVILFVGESRPEVSGSGGELKNFFFQNSRFQRFKANIKKTSKKRFKKA
ncbi:hypothetical protein IWX84_002928 [Flavobacterium sp. CG_9.10]|nr:hypothetical protein [Flavobacterium sp. CG_9.10]